VGGASHGEGGQHVRAAAEERPNRWPGDDRHGIVASRVLDPAAAPRKRDPYPADPPLTEAGASLRDVMSTASVLVIGESLVDIVTRPNGTILEHSGGSAANVAVALARLGRSVQFLTALGDDQHGAVLAYLLNQSGVRIVGDPHTVSRTATAMATIGIDGSASYVFDIEWRLGALPDISPTAVHTCSIGAVLEPGAAQVRSILEHLRPGATISYDINARPALTGVGPRLVRAVEEIAALADLVKASDEDLESLYPGRSLEASAAHLLGLGPAAIIITRGDQGATWIAAGLRVDVPASPVRVADTIGAGDTFGAATIDALWDFNALAGRLPALDPAQIESVLRHAARAAAITVSRPGASPPCKQELL
jgi:fructokinase